MRRIEANWQRQDSERGDDPRWVLLVTVVLLAATEVFAGGEETAPSPATVPVNEAPHRRIIVSIPDRKLALLEDGRVLKIYPVAVGASESPSPAGEFKVINRVVGPAYYYEGKVTKPGKDNPLGSRWMGLSKKSYGIHGTNAPASIGKAASHGCIRMGKRDVEELFELVRVGDTVEIYGARNAEVEKVLHDPEQVGEEAVVASDAARPVPSALVVAAMTNQF